MDREVCLYFPHVTFKSDVSHLSRIHDASQKTSNEALLHNKTITLHSQKLIMNV